MNELKGIENNEKIKKEFKDFEINFGRNNSRNEFLSVSFQN